ncbi:MAG: dTDP-4-dehydrorhamnose reductase [Muribaculaceae bacterium]|nr:dTDP-4-dehydrorhamnose reductase [Muribaculaceae bacterium]
MKILVTGANGQLGRELKLLFDKELPDSVIYTDKQELDITDQKAVENFVIDNEITHIINCAAYTDVERAEDEKLECSALNFIAVKNVAMAADAGGAKVIHISTDYVFDGTAHRPYRESDKVNPISQYGTTKRKGETALIALAPESIIIRTAWLYSPYGRNFVRTMLRLFNSQPEVKVVCDQIGSPTYAGDVAKAILKIIKSNQWVSGIYHFTSEGVASWYDFAKAIARLTRNTKVKITPIMSDEFPQGASRPYYCVLDRNRIKATYGVAIPHWEESLAECIGKMDDITPEP